MPRPCSICRHPAVADINAGIESGKSYASLARCFGVSVDATERHSRHLRIGPPADEPQGAANKWLDRYERLFKRCESKGDLSGSLKAATAATRLLTASHDLASRSVGSPTGQASGTPSLAWLDSILRSCQADDEAERAKGNICRYCNQILRVGSRRPREGGSDNADLN